MNPSGSAWRAFVVAVCAALVAYLANRVVAIELLGTRGGLTAFLIATIAATWLGGMRAGLLATAFSALVGTYSYFVARDGMFPSPTYFVRLVLFLGTGGLISVLLGSLQNARRTLELRSRQLEHEAAERKSVENAERAQRQLLATEMNRREAAEAALRDREEHVRLAVESANVGTWDYNPNTGERHWSTRAKTMLGLAPDVDVSQTSMLDFIHPNDMKRVRHAVAQAFDPAGDGRFEIEGRVVLPTGESRWMIGRGQALFSGEGSDRRPQRLIGTVIDISKRKHDEEALRASENRLQAILNNASAIIYLKDPRNCYRLVNKHFQDCYRLPVEQILGKTDSEVFSREIAAALQANDEQVRTTGSSLEFEEEVHINGDLRTFISIKFPVDDPTTGQILVGGISTDITDRKRALELLQAEQELMRHTIEQQDRERQLIVYEIHDSLIQYAAGAIMQLEAMRDRGQSTADTPALDSVISTLRKSVEEGRRLINGIRTPVLDDWGVVAAIEQLLDEEERAGVSIEFIKENAPGRMPPTIEEALYRITQEALNNIHKHSQANRVCIRLVRREDRVYLEVQDWGIGFTPCRNVQNIHGLGVMTERARIAGGRCTIHSALGEGTRVCVDLPYVGREA